MRVKRTSGRAALSIAALLLALTVRPALPTQAHTHTTVAIGRYTVENTQTGQKTHYLPVRPVGATNVYTGTGNQPYLHSGGQIQQYTIPILVYWEDSTRGYSFQGPWPGQPAYTSYISDTINFWDTAHYESQYYGDSGTPLAVLKGYNGYLAPNTTPITYSGYVYTPTVVIDNNPYPASDCTDAHTTYCLTETDVMSEVQHVASVYTINPSLYSSINYTYVVYTPQDVGQCFDTSSTDCMSSQWCAYHSATETGSSGLPLVIDQPWPDDGSGSAAGCNNGTSLFSSVANNTVWHELAETVTDGRFDGWRGDDGNEIGDAYAWVFPARYGMTYIGPYNAVFGYPTSGGIGYYPLYLQCVMRASDGGCALSG